MFLFYEKDTIYFQNEKINKILALYICTIQKKTVILHTILKKRLSAVFWHIESGKFILTPKHSDKMSFWGVYVAV